MGPLTFHRSAREAWTLARAQHDVITHTQLRALGFTAEAVRHRRRSGRLFALWPGVYAVGRPHVTRLGLWRAATLACGPQSALCGESGAALLGFRSREGAAIEVAVPTEVRRSPAGIRVHRVAGLADHVTEVAGIPVCTVPLLLVQLAARLGRSSVEAAINEADKLDLIDPESLRKSLRSLRGRPGVAALRRILDRHTFRLSQSELERRCRPIARRAGLPEPEMGAWVNGYFVDFWWPALNLVVETDGLRYHRTAITQTRDLVREQTHDAAGTAHLRFSHAQIAYEADYVRRVLATKRRQIESSGR
jgi:very-short-patch-repair endonuclease